MQKSAIALAVAATLAASAVAHAETTFYGSFRMGVEYFDQDGIDPEDINSPDDLRDFFDEGVWDVTNESSRWGVRGSEDLGNGLSAIYQMETQVRADVHDGSGFSGRLAWVGLKGGFGAVKLGAQWSPYYNVTGRTDVFNAVWFNDAMYPSGTFRKNNALVYETPDSIGLFKGEAMVNMDGGADGKDSVDEYNLGANFNVGPAGLGVAYLDNRVSDQDQWAATAGVDFAGFNIAALYEDIDGTGNAISGLVQYAFGNNIVRGAYGQFDPDTGDKADTWALGFQHNLSSRTRVWAEYEDVEETAFTQDREIAGSKFNIGMRHDF